MVVTLNDLGSYDFRGETHFLADVFFYIGVDIRIGAYSAGKFAYCHFFSCPFHSVDISKGFRIPEEEFQAEGGGFCMNAVGSADGGGVLEFYSSSLQYICQFLEVVQEAIISWLMTASIS